MEQQCYVLNRRKSVSAGNYNTYVYGELHPDRILSEHDFVYMLSGTWEICQDDKIYTVQADDVILLHAGKHHCSLNPCSPGTKNMFIHFGMEEGDQGETASDEETVSLPVVINCQSNPKVKELFSEIIFSRISTEYGAKARMNAQLCLLLLELHNSCQSREECRDELVFDIVKLFQNNPSRSYTMQELSEMFYLSGKTIDRRFRKIYGKSAYSYQNDLKLEAVKQDLIEYPESGLHKIALNHGFYDEFHLSKMFSRKYGISPKGYRKDRINQGNPP